MSDIIEKRASESLGKEITVFLLNGFRYSGKLTNCDETYLELVDYKTSSYKYVRLDDIKDMEIKQ